MQNYPWCHVEEHAGRTWSACQLDAGTVSERLTCFAEERIAFTAINVYFLGSRNVNRNAGMLHYAVLLCFLFVCVQGLSAVPFRALASFRNLVWRPAFFLFFFLRGTPMSRFSRDRFLHHGLIIGRQTSVYDHTCYDGARRSTIANKVRHHHAANVGYYFSLFS